MPGKKVAVIGFCFGGGMMWKLLAAGEPRCSRSTASNANYNPTAASQAYAAVLDWFGRYVA